MDHKKLVVGWFSFTGCEGCIILLTELLNDHLDEWKKLVEFRHLKVLKSKNSLEGLDVAFVEGAVSSDSQAEEVKKIRDNAKYVVAVGSCACTGLPSASRNDFPADLDNPKVNWFMHQFNYSSKVCKVADVVKVDDMVPGCPMNATLFLQILQKYFKLFNIA